MSTWAASDLVQPISSSSGIYFDYLGKLRIIDGHLSVITPLDISNFRTHIDNVNSAIGTIRFLCVQKYNTGCHDILEPLTIRYNSVEKQFSSLSHLIENRAKRGAWFGGIGTVFKHIFGVLDEDDALRYDDAINSVQSDTRNLASLVKQNILVTTSTISAYNNSLHKLKTNEDRLNLAIDNLSTIVKNISTISNDLLSSIHFISIFNNIETALLALSFQIEDIVNSILFSNVHILHPSILTPQQLYRELADNYRHFPNNLELAVSLQLNSIHSILNVSTIVSYYLNHKIIFVLRIPLVTPVEFYLYHSIPLPVPHNLEKPDSFSLVVPSARYIAITKDKSHYASIDNLSECKNVDIQNHICKIVNVFPTSANPCCESEILSKVLTILPVQCKTEFLHGNLDIWKSLINNRWIFVQSLPTKLSIDCYNTELKEENIIGTGIVRIPTHCSAYCKSTKLYTNDNVFNISSPVISYSKFNIVNDSCCNINKFRESINDAPPIALQNLDLENIDFNYNTVTKSLVKNLNKIIDEPHIIKYGAHYSVLSIMIILLIIIVIIFKLYTKLYKSKGKPFPTIFKVRNKEIIQENKSDEVNVDKQTYIDIETSAPKIRTKI